MVTNFSLAFSLSDVDSILRNVVAGDLESLQAFIDRNPKNIVIPDDAQLALSGRTGATFRVRQVRKPRTLKTTETIVVETVNAEPEVINVD